MELISNLIGIIGIAFLVISMIFKKKTWILVFTTLYNVILAISYILLGHYIGCILLGISTIRGIVYFLYAYKNKKVPIFFLIFFEIAYIVTCIFLWEKWYDAFVLVNSIFVTYTTWQDDMIVYKISAVISMFLWIAYDICTGAYIYIISEVLFGMTALISVIVLIKKGEKNEHKNNS